MCIRDSFAGETALSEKTMLNPSRVFTYAISEKDYDKTLLTDESVSYTHLDVYKRQGIYINAVSVWIVFCKYRSHRIKSPYRSINHLLKK